MDSELFILVALSNTCNLKCDYCIARYTKEKRTNYEVLSKEVKWAVEQFPDKSLHICIEYMEPLVEFDNLKRLIEESYSYNVRAIEFVIFTNGVLLDEEKLDFFRKHKGRIALTLSIDGDRAGTSGRVSKGGKHLFDLVNIEKLVKENGDLFERVNLTVNRYNIRGLCKQFLYIADTLKIKSLGFLAERGYKWSEEEVKIFDEQMEKLFFEYIKRYGTADEIFLKNAVEYAKGGYVEGFCRAKNGNILYIDNEGKIYPCSEIIYNPDVRDNFLIGDITTSLNHERYEEVLEGLRKSKQCNCFYSNTCCYSCPITNGAKFIEDSTNMCGILTTGEKWALRQADYIKKYNKCESNSIMKRAIEKLGLTKDQKQTLYSYYVLASSENVERNIFLDMVTVAEYLKKLTSTQDKVITKL